MAILFTSCQEKYTHDPQVELMFSTDTLRFDTVFTEQDSYTLQLKVYNHMKRAILIRRISLQDGEHYRINVDGEADLSRLHDLTLSGKDSMIVFVKSTTERQESNLAVRIEDKILFDIEERVQEVVLESYAQNVRILRSPVFETDTTLHADCPYLLFDTLVCLGTLTIEGGTTIYMHDGACIFCLGDLNAIGTADAPITIIGDRLDNIMTNVPYNYISGKWNGIYCLQQSADHTAHRYTIDHLILQSGTVGLYCLSERQSNLPRMVMSNSIVHNFSAYGIVLQNTDATITNCAITNCASYCIYLSGGKHTLVHNTIANYFQNLNIQPVSREDVATLYINNLSKQQAETQTFFYNNILTGNRTNALVLATPLPQHYVGEFAGNYLRTDTLPSAIAHDNVYYTPTDTIFRNISLHRSDDGEHYDYYDFRLDSCSKARKIADVHYTTDYLLTTDLAGTVRDTETPDAGCYEWTAD